MSSPPFAFLPTEPTHWMVVAAAALVVGGAKKGLGMMIGGHQNKLFAIWGYINPAFKPHESLDSQDIKYLSMNCFITVGFFYHFLNFLWTSPGIVWDLQRITLYNTVVTSLLQFTVYDFFYHFFHRALHHRLLYPHIHKHHHKNKAPFRGVFDGINIHPFEMVVGIYLHLLAVYLVPCHIVGAQVFMTLGSLMAAINHTRWAVRCPGFYDVRDHDMHHVYFNYNYAQYVMWWDKLFGTFKEADISWPKEKPYTRPPNEKLVDATAAELAATTKERTF